jgi:hypothetical protein
VGDPTGNEPEEGRQNGEAGEKVGEAIHERERFGDGAGINVTFLHNIFFVENTGIFFDNYVT